MGTRRSLYTLMALTLALSWLKVRSENGRQQVLEPWHPRDRLPPGIPHV